mmetsp:Transcript_116526/g.183286  ORF Transcript_116526/g.183286 Transcript_116526/m.183286 type:complete len:218 (-) Transcript_116526:223-876(-)
MPAPASTASVIPDPFILSVLSVVNPQNCGLCFAMTESEPRSPPKPPVANTTAPFASQVVPSKSIYSTPVTVLPSFSSFVTSAPLIIFNRGVLLSFPKQSIAWPERTWPIKAFFEPRTQLFPFLPGDATGQKSEMLSVSLSTSKNLCNSHSTSLTAPLMKLSSLVSESPMTSVIESFPSASRCMPSMPAKLIPGAQSPMLAFAEFPAGKYGDLSMTVT